MTIRICLLMFCALARAAAPDAINTLTAQEKKDGYTLLFNGKNLDGWDGDPVRWSVQDGLIVGSSDGHPFKVNTFLIHKGVFKNFVLKADIKLRNHNSGIQFRSEQLPGDGWMVRGYQADASEHSQPIGSGTASRSRCLCRRKLSSGSQLGLAPLTSLTDD